MLGDFAFSVFGRGNDPITGRYVIGENVTAGSAYDIT